MLLINLFKNFKIKSILSIFFLALIILACTLWQIKINDNRIIYWEPDDHFTFLNKTASFDYCKNEFDVCMHKNLISDDPNFDKKNFGYQAQIHRVILSYHPLYTYLLGLISNFFNIFDSQKLLHIAIGIIQGAIIFYYVNYFTKNKLISSISILLLSSHYYYNSPWGIYYPAPWSISVLIASIALTTEKKFYTFFIMIVAGLFHKVGLLICILILLTKIINFYLNLNNKNIKSTFNIFKNELLISFCIFLLVYKFTYTPFDDVKISIISVYDFELDYNYFITLFIKNVKALTMGVAHLLTLSPILFLFFILFYKKKTNNHKIEKLKIFFFLLILSSIFYPLESGGFHFALGYRSWHLITINYVILSTYMVFNSVRYNDFFKLTFIYTLPIFLYLGLIMNYNAYFFNNKQKNFFLDYHEAKKTVNQLPQNKNIYFDTNLTNFYFYIANGLIKKNFYYPSNFPKKNLNGIIVKDNPIINIHRNSSFVIENETKIMISKNKENNSKPFYLQLYSKQQDIIRVNNQNTEISKGYNSILVTKNTDIFFNKVSAPIYLIGLKINNNQSLQWPWGNDISLEIENKEYKKINIKNLASYFINYPQIESYKQKTFFNFKNLPNFNDLCTNNNIISDSGSIIVFNESCIKLKD